jgi:hypothetical protein
LRLGFEDITPLLSNMDGLSAAASGIAVVSLTIQLVDSVRHVRHFLKRVSDAPKELRRLLDLLEQLELILENIGSLIERQNSQHNDHDAPISRSVLKALETCEEKLVMLEDIIAAAKKASHTNLITRSFGSFKLACKSSDIEDFESQLQHSVSVLNLTMTMNLTWVSPSSVIAKLISPRAQYHNVNATLDRLTTITTDTMTIFHSRSNLQSFPNHSGPSIHESDKQSPTKTMDCCNKSQARVLRNQKAMTCHYKTPFGTIRWRSVQSSVTLGNHITQMSAAHRTENTVTFMPSFFSRCIEMRFADEFGMISRQLRTY